MKLFFCFFLLFDVTICNAQKIFIKNYYIGYSLLEREAFGNNPLTITPLIKNKTEYLNSINSFLYDGISGNPGIEKLKTWQFIIELSKMNTNSFFWNRFTIKAGIGISGNLKKTNMSLFNDVFDRSDTANFKSYKTTYLIEHENKQINMVAGLTYKVKLFKHVRFSTGLIFQPNLTIYSSFKRSIISDTFEFTTRIRKVSTNQLSTLEGISIFSYNIYIPVGFEINAYKEQVFLRSVLNAGFLYSKYYAPETKFESNGIEFGIIYQPKRK